MEQQSHTSTDSSLIHVLKSIRLLVFFLCQSTQHLYISPKNRLKERCPKECVYKLPINTLTHALMHAHTRTPTVYIPLFPLCRRSRQYLSDTLPPLSLVEARLAQVSVAKTNKTKQKCRMLSFVIFCFFKSKHIEFNLEFCLGLKRHSK